MAIWLEISGVRCTYLLLVCRNGRFGYGGCSLVDEYSLQVIENGSVSFIFLKKKWKAINKERENTCIN